jgi:coniferyl-aldehyde dehydrogenase
MSEATEATFEQMQETLRAMRNTARAKRIAPSLEERLQDLEKLEQQILKYKDEVATTISADFGNRSKYETFITEIFLSLSELRHTKSHLAEWMTTEERDVGFAFFPARAELRAQPLGVVGIISPWNYPFQLAMVPLVAAIAAGNRVLLKPSELTPKASSLMKKMLAEVFPDDQVSVFEGGVRVAQDFARLPLDHMLFTGSTAVGKLVMKAAAENLVPVTLELGGKSPAIVSPEYSIEKAAAKLMTGKLVNAGQTCVAPDYVLLPKARQAAFVDACKQAFLTYYPNFQNNVDYTSIAQTKHFDRLQALLVDAESKGAEVVALGPDHPRDADPDTRKLPPSLVLGPKDEMLLMQEEIFGPILPICTYEEVDEAIAYVNHRPRPLSLYVFDDDESRVERILQETTAGGVTVNETMLHIAQSDLPFGGVGPSGMGHYHGREGFQTFSKRTSVVYQSRINATGLLRPPFSKLTDRILNFLIG